ncbi:MAG: FG-GAP-like repeat-containing protein, partial [Planctomycetota bacterium]
NPFPNVLAFVCGATKGRFLSTLLVGALSVAAVAGCNRSDKEEDSSARRPESFRTKISALKRARNWAAAEKLVTAELLQKPSDVDLLTLSAEIALEQKDWSAADARFEAAFGISGSLSDSDVMAWVDAKSQAGEIFLAIELLQKILRESSSPSADLHRKLAELHSIVGDSNEARRQLRKLVELKAARGDELFSVAMMGSRYKPNEALVERALQAHPEDRRVLLGRVVDAWIRGERPEAVRIATEILESNPEHEPTIAFKSFLLCRDSRDEELTQLLRQHPPGSVNHPMHWYASGRWFLQNDMNESASSCFAKSLSLAEHDRHLPASQLATALGRIGATNWAKLVAKRATLLQELQSRCNNYFEGGLASQTNSIRIAGILNSIGRHAEAVGWSGMASAIQDDPFTDLDEAQRQIARKPPSDSFPKLLASINRRYEVSEESLAALAADTGSHDLLSHEADVAEQPPLLPLQFRDESSDRGLVFSFDTGEKSERIVVWLYQVNGGGVAIADFDLNGFDDVYLSQSGTQPLKESLQKQDQIFANHNGFFTSVPPGVTEQRDFGQGVAAGDVNGDGFPDVFVGTIGKNRLLINNGDGYFTDQTETCGIEGERWTSSVAIADVNTDGSADLIEINYCTLDDVLERPCRNSTGQFGACAPVDFDGEHDRLWLGNGDGTFSPAEPWTSLDVPGRGLGLTIADFDQRPGVEIFVSNDMSANHFWSLDSSGSWQESAVVRGLAFGPSGRPQACMGIAAGDPDEDGDLDLVVTNFENESNNFYRQGSAGLFVDASRSTGLAEPSKQVLGFGTLMEDFDLDGNQDLLVFNGHVDEPKDPNDAMAQIAQRFRWQNGRWAPDSPPSDDDYFLTPHVGRAVARGDFDNDGRPDVIVGHLGEPTRLLMNRTEAQGEPFRVRLVGTVSHRDAVGTQIEFRTNSRTIRAQRTAGSGYYCSHSPVMSVTLERDEKVQKITLRWPSGGTQSVVPVEGGGVQTIVELP